MIVVTYSSDHNHPWPPSRNHHSNKSSAGNGNKGAAGPAEPAADRVGPEQEEKFSEMMSAAEEMGWFGEMDGAAATSSAAGVLESTMLTGEDGDVASMFLPMREEDESLFADLGELPECSVVFRRVGMEREEERRRRAAAWCGTTS